MNKHLLGIHTAYPEKYSPEILFPISRKESREKIGIKNKIPFNGLDIWNAWEFSWIGKNGIPRVLDAGCRLSGSVGASLVAGFDIPAQLVRIMMNLPLVKYKNRNGTLLIPIKTYTMKGEII